MWVKPNLFELILLLSTGVLGYTAVLYLTKSFQNGKVNIIAPVKYLEVVFTIILGICLFGEGYTLYSFLGISLILIGVILNTLTKNIFKTSKRTRN